MMTNVLLLQEWKKESQWLRLDAILVARSENAPLNKLGFSIIDAAVTISSVFGLKKKE
jgi:hypothetical protein